MLVPVSTLGPVAPENGFGCLTKAHAVPIRAPRRACTLDAANALARTALDRYQIGALAFKGKVNLWSPPFLQH